MRWKTASGKKDSKSNTPWDVLEQLNVESSFSLFTKK